MKGTKYSFNHKENLNSKHKNSFTYQKLDCDDDDEEEDNEIITEGNKLVPKNKIDWTDVQKVSLPMLKHFKVPQIRMTSQFSDKHCHQALLPT